MSRYTHRAVYQVLKSSRCQFLEKILFNLPSSPVMIGRDQLRVVLPTSLLHPRFNNSQVHIAGDKPMSSYWAIFTYASSIGLFTLILHGG